MLQFDVTVPTTIETSDDLKNKTYHLFMQTKAYIVESLKENFPQNEQPIRNREAKMRIF